MTLTPPDNPTPDDPEAPPVPGYCVPCGADRALVAGPVAALIGYYCRTCGNYATLPAWVGAARVAWIHYLQQQHGVAAALLTALPAPTQPLPVTPEADAACRMYLRHHGLTDP